MKQNVELWNHNEPHLCEKRFITSYRTHRLYNNTVQLGNASKNSQQSVRAMDPAAFFWWHKKNLNLQDPHSGCSGLELRVLRPTSTNQFKLLKQLIFRICSMHPFLQQYHGVSGTSPLDSTSPNKLDTTCSIESMQNRETSWHQELHQKAKLLSGMPHTHASIFEAA